jgi:hypothetical protein
MAEIVRGAEKARPGLELAPDQALKLLKDHGIVNKDITWEKLEQVSKRLGSGGGSPWAAKWCFIVKGKNIYQDDAK